jgi:hypothetical protein
MAVQYKSLRPLGWTASRYGFLICARACACLTDALSAHVLLVAVVTLAAVAGRRQHAASVQTQVGEVFAHVDGVVLRGT